MTLNNSMSITPSPPGQAKGEGFEHGSVLGGKTRGARVSSQWKSTNGHPCGFERGSTTHCDPHRDQPRRQKMLESLGHPWTVHSSRTEEPPLFPERGPDRFWRIVF